MDAQHMFLEFLFVFLFCKLLSCQASAFEDWPPFQPNLITYQDFSGSNGGRILTGTPLMVAAVLQSRN
ncbi:unnamed protein product [Cuscuta campestris]|uniref:Dirigent protein n=1 Tax=Cuscuta campestris TaxID=132261 RepID=A0A484NJU1_9ASTE|nr:unnamed protein product [Cuscuta campestris]